MCAGAVPAKGWTLLVGLAAFAAVALVILALASPNVIAGFPPLPALALFSFLRMGTAYLLALGFSIPYGYAAATNRRAGVVLLPVLDILQSVPILAFFPAAILFFVTATNGSEVRIVTSPQDAVRGADVVYTDVWTSMGMEREQESREREFRAYQVNADLLHHAKPDALVMHCLPAHRGLEITDDVIDGPQSIVFDQAENRLHAQKAILARFVGGM